MINTGRLEKPNQSSCVLSGFDGFYFGLTQQKALCHSVSLLSTCFFRRTKSNLTEYVNSSTTTMLGELGLLLMKQRGNAHEIPTADEMK